MATAASIDVILTANTARYRAAMLDAGRVTTQQLGVIRKEAAATAQSIQTFNRVAGGFIGFQGLKTVAVELSRIADQFSNVQAKVRLAAGENADVAASFEQIFGVAQRTFNTLDGTAALVQRGSQALRSFGQDAETAFSNSVALADLFNKGLVISGASASEAASAALQFSQALASGRFQGDEFRSVLENNSRFASLLADSLGVNIAQLRDMSKEGKLTTQTFLNLIGKTAELDAEFSRMPLTIGRAKTLLDNSFTKFIGEADQARGVSRGIASAIAGLANNLGPVVSALGQLAIVAAGALSARSILAAKAYALSLVEQANAAKAAQVATQQKAAADAQAAQATLLKARGEQVAAEQTAAAAAVDRARIQSVIAMATAQEAVIRANALRATSEIELARLSQQLTAVESARAAATLALGEAKAAEVRANAQVLVSNRALQAAYLATGIEGAAAASKITIGMRAANIAQGAMTIATRAFTGALALVGGPLGVVIIGVGLLASAFANARAKADQAASSFRSAIEAADNFLDTQSRASAIQAGTSLLAERERLRERQESLKQLRAGLGGIFEGQFLSRGDATEELRRNQAQIDETNRKLALVNKQILANHEAWTKDGQAVADSSDKHEKQNAALDKQLQNLTAQRLELTKGIRARLEFEAIQEQGVKTAAELDAGTKSRIDALVKEHSALKAASDAKKASAKADREAVSASKQQENQYTSIVDRINRQIALDKEAMLLNDKMTAAQKLQVIVTEELKSAKNKLSEAEQARVRALLDEAVAQGAAQKAMEDAKKGAEDLLRLENQLTEASRSQQQSNLIDLMGIGRGGDAVDQMRRVLDLQQEFQRQVEDLNQRSAAGDITKASYEQQLKALEQHNERMLEEEQKYQQRRAQMQGEWTNGFQKAMEDFTSYAENISGQAEDFFSNAFSGFGDAIVDFTTGTKNAFGSLLDDIYKQSLKFIANQAINQLLKAFFGGSGTAVTMGQSQGSLFDLFGGDSFSFFDKGGYTGTGSKYEPAGIVHRGEGVLSQPEIRALGGEAGFNALRRSLRGYADGGIVGGSRHVRVGANQDGVRADMRYGRDFGPLTATFNINGDVKPKVAAQATSKLAFEMRRYSRLSGSIR